jgi:DnaJ domain
MTRRRRIRYDPSNDLYTVLGIPPAAPAAAIRRSFRQRAKAVHPDHNPGSADWAHEQFQRLNEAYYVLNDPALRSEYDQKRQAYREHRGPDGLTWWERPHPTSARTGSGAGVAGTPPFQKRRSTWNNVRRSRRAQTRPYEVLFVLSALMLAGSLCAWMLGAPGNRRLVNGNLAAVAEPQPAMSGSPAAQPLCSNVGALIVTPSDGDDVSGPFAITGTATSSQFAWYTLEISLLSGAPQTDNQADDANSPSVSHPVITLTGSARVVNGPLASEAVTRSLIAGDYLLRLTVGLRNGATLAPCEVRFRRHYS